MAVTDTETGILVIGENETHHHTDPTTTPAGVPTDWAIPRERKRQTDTSTETPIDEPSSIVIESDGEYTVGDGLAESYETIERYYNRMLVFKLGALLQLTEVTS